MNARWVAAALAPLLGAAVSQAQQPGAPLPLYPSATPPSVAAEPLPPVGAATPASSGETSPVLPPAAAPPTAPPPAAAPAAAAPSSAPAGRVFCDQPVTVQVAEREALPEHFRRFVGIWSDASWSPQLCAALIVSNVAPDGTAAIVYVFGPMGSATRGASGVLHGTGIVRDGELRFQNSDGSQFAFRPLYADLAGHLTTPQGQSYQAIFKKAP